MLIQGIVEDRKKSGRREEDALQFLIDQGDSLIDMITVSTQRCIITDEPD